MRDEDIKYIHDLQEQNYWNIVIDGGKKARKAMEEHHERFR